MTRGYYVELVSSGVEREAATYDGMGTYEANDQLYEEAASQPGFEYNYRIVPKFGWAPSRIGWRFRNDDTDRMFAARIVAANDATATMDLDVVASGLLLLRQVNLAAVGLWGYPLVMGLNGEITHDFSTSNLPRPGIYLVIVQLEFDSGRQITLDSVDGPMLEVVS